jgi:hypothetical protein
MLRFRDDGFVLLGGWSARHVLSSSELLWSCTGCNAITWTKELTLAALDAQLLGHILRFAGRTSSTNLAMACSCAFGAGLMPRPTIVTDVFDADAVAAYFDDSVVPHAWIEGAGLTAWTCPKPVLRRAYIRNLHLGPLLSKRCRAVGRHFISDGLHSWAFHVSGISHVRFGVLRIPEQHEQQHGCIDGPDLTWLLPFVELSSSFQKDFRLILDLDERDLRVFSFFGDRRTPVFLHSIANLPCGSYKLVVELAAIRFEIGYVMLLGNEEVFLQETSETSYSGQGHPLKGSCS